MSVTLSQGVRIDDDVVQVCNAVDVYAVAQYSVDVALECRGGVGQAEGDDRVHELPVAGLKGRFIFVTLLDAHVMVRIADIEFGEVPVVHEPIESLFNQVQGLPIFPCN